MIVPILLALLNVVVYSGVGAFGFVNWDDPADVYENPIVIGGLSLSAAWWALTTTSEPYWQPVTWLSHLAVVSLFGLDAGAHHVVNVAIHALNTVLVFAVLRQFVSAPAHPLTRAQRDPLTLSPTHLAAIASALFAVHPLHVESVAWITERKDVLSGLFWLLAMWSYCRYAARPGVARYLEVTAWFVLAVMAKPMVVTLPAVLMLMDVWPLRRGWRVAEKVPLFAISAAVSVLTFVVQSRVGAVAAVGALGWWPRVSNALVSYVRYIGKFLWPAKLEAFYPMQPWAAPVVLAAAGALLVVTWLAWRRRASQPYILWGWLYYLITLTPVIGVVQSGEQAMADRFLYLPMIGLLVIVVWGAADIARVYVPARSRRALLGGAAAIAIAACAVAARVQAAVWSESVTLWEHALAVDQNNYIAHEKLGAALRDLGRIDEARASFERSRAAAPANSPVFLAVVDNLIGMTYLSQGQVENARAKFAEAVRENPGLAEAQNNLGNALGAGGRTDEALVHFDEAIRLKPDFVEPRIGRGGALIRGGQPGPAAEEFRRALAIDPSLAEAHNGLGSALAFAGDATGAEAEYRTAIRLKPGLATAHFNLAVLLAKSGRVGEARASLERALAADPNFAQARQLLDALAR